MRSAQRSSLTDVPSRIIGILPESFQFRKADADVWEPHTMFRDWESRRAVRGVGSWFVVGRLRPNAILNRPRRR